MCMKKLLISSMLFVSCKSTINLTSLRLDNSIQVLDISSVIIGLELVFLNLCLIISENLLFLSFQKNPDLLIFWDATWIFPGVWIWWSKLIGHKSPCSDMTDRQRQTWQPAFLQESDKLVYGSLDLLAPEWTVVKRALCRWCSHWFPNHASSRACCRWMTPGWRFQWSMRCGSCRWSLAHNLWEDCSRPKYLTPHSRKRTKYFSPNRPTWKMKMKIRRMKRKMRETVKSAMWESKRIKTHNHMKHGWHDAHCTLSQCHVRHCYECRKKREMWRMKVFCSQ